MPLGVQDELKPIRDAIENCKADVVFNLLEEFHGETAYDQNVASYLELLRDPLYRLQSARPDAGARQGPVEEAAWPITASRCRPSPCSRCGAR